MNQHYDGRYTNGVQGAYIQPKHKIGQPQQQEGGNPYIENLKRRAAELKVKGVELFESGSAKSKQIASDRRVQVTAASVVGGSSVLGAVGAGTGLFVGGTIGAVVGVPLAIFTFGMSIPITGAIGAGCGAFVGGGVGATTGGIGGGAVGFTSYTKRAEIKQFVAEARVKLSKIGMYLKHSIKHWPRIAQAKVTETGKMIRKKSGDLSNIAKAKATETGRMIQKQSEEFKAKILRSQ